MTVYRVGVSLTGVLRVEADSPEEAESLAKRATPTMSGKNMFGVRLEAKTLGEVENKTFQPEGVRQHSGISKKPPKTTVH